MGSSSSTKFSNQHESAIGFYVFKLAHDRKRLKINSWRSDFISILI